jgi:bifunctional DNase/RNase
MKIQLTVQGITYSQTQNNAYALILKEVDGSRRMPIIIGGFEAQSIAIKFENIKYTRPLTHDLFKSFAEEFEIEITEVVIYKFEEGVFFSTLVCNNGKETRYIEARTSDAVSLAIRFNCPIYTYEKILSMVAIHESDLKNVEQQSQDEYVDEGKEIDELEYYSLEELSTMLEHSIEEENYELASKIRDEIEKRKSK